ncbi:MAG: hypothetical protein JNL83_10190 [Myxococcales bacterium]|nr:hypothetical protein [Myxococcales bacterium]
MLRALWLAVPLALAGCIDDLPPEEPGPHDITTPIAKGACTMLEGVEFKSVNQGECGLTPDGVAMCTWHIRFESYDGSTRSRFTWSHSDVGESGFVTCDGTTLVAEGAGATPYSGTFDPNTFDLVWDGGAYVAK